MECEAVKTKEREMHAQATAAINERHLAESATAGNPILLPLLKTGTEDTKLCPEGACDKVLAGLTKCK